MTATKLLPLGVTGVMLPELGFEEQLALCRALGLTHYVYRPRTIPESAKGQPFGNWGNQKFDLTPQRLLDEGVYLREKVEAAGLVPFGTVPNLLVDAPEAELRLHFQGAAAAGARCVRVNPPNYPHEVVFDYPKYLGETIERYRAAVALARPHDVKLVIEMHAGNAATSPGLAWNIVRHFEPAHLGVIVDLPNFAREGFVSPSLAVSVLGDWIDHAHFGGCRRVEGVPDERGFRRSDAVFCGITESDLHVPTWARHLASLGREVPLIIEDYTPNMPGAARLTREAAAARRMLEGLAP